MLGNFPMERYLLTCLTFWTRGSILINYKVRLRLPREELICDWIKAAQLYIHQQDPDLIMTTPTISRNQQCWPSWVEGIGWRGRPLANIGRQRNAASCLAPPLLHHHDPTPPPWLTLHYHTTITITTTIKVIMFINILSGSTSTPPPSRFNSTIMAQIIQ